NLINGCDVPLAGILFQNSSGRILRSTIFGAQLKSGRSCSVLFPGNGFGIEIQSDGNDNYSVTVDSSNIHHFGRDGILAMGDRLGVEITGNVITGRGPASGDFQFGVFLANGVRGNVAHNTITQANCGSLPIAPCADLRSEGIVLRQVADGTVV